MPGKLTKRGQKQEELMEAYSYYDNFLEDLDGIIDLIDKNQTMDHQNDVTRRAVVFDLLSALRSLNCKDHAAADNFVHAALQRINEQERQDLADDLPRTQARIKLAVLRQKALTNADNVRNMIGNLTKTITQVVKI